MPCATYHHMTHDMTKQIRWNERLQAMLDEIRKYEDDLPSSSEMLRRLTERAAATLTKKGKR